MNFWNLLRHITLKHFRLRKAQIFMAAAGICLGVTAIVSIGMINKSVLFSFEDSFNRVTGKAKLQITGAQSGFPETLVEKVQGVEGVEYAVPVIETDGLLVAGKERAIMIMGIDVLLDSQVREYSLSGDSADVPDPLLFLAKRDSILVTKTMADREGFVIDQKIQVQTVDGIKSLRIRGIMNPEGPAKAMGGNMAIMDIFAAQMAFGKDGRVDRIDVSLREGTDLETVRKAIVNALPQGYMVDTPVGRTKQVEEMIARFQKGLDLISYLSIFVGMYLIYNAVSISVVNRRKEIGILRALGCLRRDIILLFLGEIFIISVIASLLGVGLGLLLADSLVGAFGKVVSETYVRTSVSGIHFTWFYPVLGLMSGIFASLTAALFPARTSSLISPVSAIRSVPYAEEKFYTTRRLNAGGVLCLILAGAIFAVYKFTGDSPLTKDVTLLIIAQLMVAIGISLFTPAFLKGFVNIFNHFFSTHFGAAGRLAGLNLRKNLIRNSVAVAAVFFGIAVFVASVGFTHSIKQSVVKWLDSMIIGDVIVTSGHPGSSANAHSIPMPVEMSAQLEKVPGVQRVAPWRRVFMSYNGRRVLLSVASLSRYPNHRNKDTEGVTNGGPAKDTVVVSEPFAAIFKVKKGDVITLPTPSGPVKFDVAGIVVDYSSDAGVIGMDIPTYQRHWGDMLCNSFFLAVHPGTDVKKVCAEIQSRFGVDRKLYVLSSLEFKEEIRKILDDMFFFNYTLNIITLTIACLGIIVALLASVMERTREIGTLRAIGTLRKQIYGVIILESILMGIAGGILGSVAGIFAGWVSLEGFFSANYGSAAQYYLPWSSIMMVLLLSAILAALSGMIPARKAAKTNIVEALSYE